ncbi:MAG: DNA polymerase III subunit gamma/tau [Bacteroidota bacterium]
MSYVVSARKYRPQTFEEVVGQEHVTRTIKNAILADKLAHAFLFCGPRGVGKTTCARLLAKVINMPDPQAAVQDGSYATHDSDISLNIVELDAASNNKVEHMHALMEQVRILPPRGSHKVFIIDEVHMLSTNAFNAFLKTLEEPPPHAIFILATTERHKILPTILSRCQIYDFRRIQIADIIRQLEQVATQEGIATEYDALNIIAQKADGAMRDALSIFDRIASASSDGVSVAAVINNLNVLDFEYFFRGVDFLISEDSSGLLLLYEEVLSKGFDGDLFLTGMASHLRFLLYCKEEPTQAMIQMSDQLKGRYIRQSSQVSFGFLLTALNVIHQADLSFSRAKDKRLHVEISLLKLCYIQRQSIPEITTTNSPQKKTLDQSDAPQVIVEPQKEMVSPGPVDRVMEASSPEVRQVINEGKAKLEADKKTSQRAVNTPSLSSVDDLLADAASLVNAAAQLPKAVTPESLEKVWAEYASAVTSPTTMGILRNVKTRIIDGAVKVTVPTNVAKEEIQQEVNLYSTLRAHYNRPDLIIEVEVDRDQFPDHEQNKSIQKATPRERYEHLKSINPKLDGLIDHLDLKLDT